MNTSNTKDGRRTAFHWQQAIVRHLASTKSYTKSERSLILAVLPHVNDHGIAERAQTRIADVAGMERETVRNCARSLALKRFLRKPRVRRLPNSQRYGATIWRFREAVLFAADYVASRGGDDHYGPRGGERHLPVVVSTPTRGGEDPVPVVVATTKNTKENTKENTTDNSSARARATATGIPSVSQSGLKKSGSQGVGAGSDNERALAWAQHWARDNLPDLKLDLAAFTYLRLKNPRGGEPSADEVRKRLVAQYGQHALRTCEESVRDGAGKVPAAAEVGGAV